MELSAVQSAVESILFAMGNSVEIAKMAEIMDIETGLVEEALDALEEKYKSEESGLQLVRLEDAVQLCTKPENYDYLIKVTKAKPKFSL